MRLVVGYTYTEVNKLLRTHIQTHSLITNVSTTFINNLNPRYFHVKAAIIPCDEEPNQFRMDLYNRQKVQLIFRFRFSENEEADYKKLISTNGRGPFPVAFMRQASYRFFEEGVEGYHTNFCDSFLGLPESIEFIDFDLGNINDDSSMIQLENGIPLAKLLAKLMNDCAEHLFKSTPCGASMFPVPTSPAY